eukprot:CAMPEP_0119507062 /NCGR_PEP_ID=MMETSP1344-20130328/27077_1 /TAXON_ID=236787 /ORGANISM="Florenciella parvula, Strain CCMP2471" /LENGTH=81 /DNA_ID=CAMNT_0007543661 /DNA_START=183 /DNA_END=425 /DNA_ORIENTATION=+
MAAAPKTVSQTVLQCLQEAAAAEPPAAVPAAAPAASATSGTPDVVLSILDCGEYVLSRHPTTGVATVRLVPRDPATERGSL